MHMFDRLEKFREYSKLRGLYLLYQFISNKNALNKIFFVGSAQGASIYSNFVDNISTTEVN